MNKRVKIGSTDVTLNDKNFLTSGGEGLIFKIGSTIVKLLEDPQRANRDRWELLKRELSGNPAVIAPQDIVLDASTGAPLGFTMRAVENASPLGLYFTVSFKTRHGLTHEPLARLYSRVHDLVSFAHSKRALIVDGNELNYLVTHEAAELVPHAIDVDSWQIGPFKATALKPTVQDFTSQTFTELTDWYGFGVIMFQLFCGIHPYRGKLDPYRPGDLAQRVIDHASVFSPKAVLPTAVSLSDLPATFRDWALATFHEGKRTSPPRDVGAVAAKTAASVAYKLGRLTVDRYLDLPFTIETHRQLLTDVILYSHGGAWRLEASGLSPVIDPLTKQHYGWGHEVKHDSVKLYVNKLSQDLPGPGTFVHVDELEGPLALYDNKLYRYRYRTAPDMLQASASPVLTQSSRVFPGLIYTDLFGSAQFTLLRTSPQGEPLSYVLSLRAELVGRRVLDAWSRSSCLLLVTVGRDGDYVGHELCLSRDLGHITSTRLISLSGPAEVSACWLPEKDLVLSAWEGELRVFNPNSPTDSVLSPIDPQLRLFHIGAKVYGYRDQTIYSVKLS